MFFADLEGLLSELLRLGIASQIEQGFCQEVRGIGDTEVITPQDFFPDFQRPLIERNRLVVATKFVMQHSQAFEHHGDDQRLFLVVAFDFAKFSFGQGVGRRLDSWPVCNRKTLPDRDRLPLRHPRAGQPTTTMRSTTGFPAQSRNPISWRDDSQHGSNHRMGCLLGQVASRVASRRFYGFK